MVIAFRVPPEHTGRLVGQRRIDVNRNGLHPAFAHQLLDTHHQLLRASHREGGDKDLALVRAGVLDEVLRFLFHLLAELLMQPIAVGRLQDQHVAGRRWFRITKDGHVRSS